MAVKNEIYKCFKCGNVVEVLAGGEGELVCCGEPMKLMNEKNKDGAGEKHVPVAESSGDGMLVKVSTVEHPMEADHWIQMIEVIKKDGKIERQGLNPGDKPEAYFAVKPEDAETVREFCN